MSSQSHSGGAGDQSHSVGEKADVVKHLQAQGQHGLQHIMAQPIPAGALLKTEFQGGTKAIFTSRPIAPAPVPAAASHLPTALPISVSGTAQVVSGSAMAKVPVLSAGMGGVIHDPSRHIGVAQGGTPVAVNLSATPAIVTSASYAVGQTAAATIQTATTVQNVAIAGGLHSSSGGIMTSQVPLQMASLIRASLPQVVQPQAGSVQTGHSGATTQPVVVTHTPPTHTLPQAPIVHAFPAHLPRGAAAASALTAAPRGSTVATAMLRPSATQPNVVQIPITTATQAMTQAHQLQSRALLQVRPGSATSPVTRSGSPLGPTGQQADAHRVGMALPGQPPSSNTTVQITIQPTRSVSDINRTQQPTPSPSTGKVPFSQSIVQSAHQKLVMSPATVTPIIQPPATAAGAVMGVAGSRTGPTPIALNLSQSITRHQKVLVSQASLAGTSPVPGPMPTLGGSSQSFAFSQPHSHTSKIVVSQPSVSHAIQTSTVITAAPKTVSGAPALNLTAAAVQQQQRGQKVVMPHVSVAGAQPVMPPAAVPSGTLPKTGSTPIMIQHAARTATLTAVTTTVTAVPSIPIAKVTPHQRQITQAAASGHEVLTREPSQQQPQAHPLVVPQSQRAVGVSNPPAATVTVASTQPEARATTAERPGFPAGVPYAAIPHDYGTYYGASIVNYQGLMYPQVSGQALTSLASLRPTFVPGQTSNLAATLQAATHGVRVSTGGGQGVSVNPVMVTVDQARHATPVTVPAQHPASAEVKASHPPLDGSTTVASAVVSTPHPTGIAPPGAGLGSNPPRQASPGITGSPRPSILRKRPADGSVGLVKKNLMSAVSALEQSGSASELSTPTLTHAVSPRTHIQDMSQENSQSSTDTASSAESTPQSATLGEVKVKQEPADGMENVNSNNTEDVSPRKQRRKQLLQTTELKDGNSTDEEVQHFTAKVNLKKELEDVVMEDVQVKQEEVEEYLDEEGIRWVRDRKRPPVLQLLNFYQCTWKARHNHFLRYSDVKPKEERRPTVNELANQKAIHQKASGWKFYHLATQLEEMIDNEKEVYNKLVAVQEAIAPKHMAKHPTMEDDIGMVHELSQGNIQRSRLLMDQIHDSRTALLKVLNHKKCIMDIVNKHHSKRPVKKKERT